MFDKILIANRGEIACRVIRTAADMGIKTVAVYSDADQNARHKRLADEAIHIGPSTAQHSYLNIDAIVGAAKKSGAQAIHPGYGFLSENPDFVEAVDAAGLVFIGPSADAIRAMGLKDAAKLLMDKSGVPIVPGYHGDNQDPKFLAAEADKIGYPVLIKARAGGGGKGMRLVEHRDEFDAALSGAMREGQASFADGHVLIEKYIASPRHIEIQVFGDHQGNVIHMFERDCSLQRRHQKVIEEAPAPGMSPQMRAAMGDAAVRAAKAVNYHGAGTVEFIVDSSEGLQPDRFWFMEMNTRLQVEHPVTELITGLDLVELQIRVANEEALKISQDQLEINGWAMEARIYAEDPANNFLPAVGDLACLELPHEDMRVDSGVVEGDAITPYYDPMIAKITCHASDRTKALEKMQAGLSKTFIGGTTTNVAFLSALCRNEEFGRGNVDTGLIARHLESLIQDGVASSEDIAIGALLLSGLISSPQTNASIQQLVGWRHWDLGKTYVDVDYNGDVHSCVLMVKSTYAFVVLVDGREHRLNLAADGAAEQTDARSTHEKIRFEREGSFFDVLAVRAGNSLTIIGDAKAHLFSLVDPLEAGSDDKSGGNVIVAPMPGLLKSIEVKAKDQVKHGQLMAVVEAMKMEHSLLAPRDGVVESVHAGVDDQVSDGMVLISLVQETDQ